MIEFVQKYSKSYGDIFFVNTLKEEMVIINHPDYAKHIFQDNNKNYIKSFAYQVLRLFLGNGLLTSEGDFWLRQRRLAQPAFHRERLQKLTESMIESTDKFVDKMNENAKNGAEFNMAHELNGLTLDIVSKALFSSDISESMEKVRTSMDIANDFAFKKIFEIVPKPMWVPTTLHQEFKKANSNLEGIINKVVESRRKNPGQYHDLLAMLMETKDEDTGETMNDRQLRDEAMTIFLAGHETTAVALSWFYYVMTTRRDIEEKIRKEVSEVCGDSPVAVQHLPQLKYTRMVIDELLRLFPPAWIIGRKALTDDVIGGYRITKDSNVLVLPFQIHRLPEFWENPNEFIPERFTPEKVKEMHKFAYFPFGGGPRQCIGNNFALMEMQVIIASTLRNFSFERTTTEDPEMEQLVTLRMKNGIKMKAVANA